MYVFNTYSTIMGTLLGNISSQADQMFPTTKDKHWYITEMREYVSGKNPYNNDDSARKFIEFVLQFRTLKDLLDWCYNNIVLERLKKVFFEKNLTNHVKLYDYISCDPRKTFAVIENPLKVYEYMGSFDNTNKVLFENLNDIVLECLDYAMAENDIASFKAYWATIMSLRNKTPKEKWAILINSGLFHDAIGKVVEVGEDFVEVSTDY